MCKKMLNEVSKEKSNLTATLRITNTKPLPLK